MNIYIIYKFSEYKYIFPQIKKFIEDNPNEKIFFFSPHNKEKYSDWKELANKKIGMADVIIYARGNVSAEYTESAFENVSYELTIAQEKHKTILVAEISPEVKLKNRKKKGFPSIIFENDYLDNKRIKYNVITCLELKSIKAAVFDLNKELFNNIENDNDSSLMLLEEFKIMLDTSEKMMDRRQGTNNFYITLCTAILTVMVALIATKINTFIWSIVTLALSAVMILICHNWKKTLEAYGLSNQAKYEVLNRIEKKLPASIFSSEWEYGKTIDYSSYSKRESKIPEIFIFLFVTIIGAMLIVICLTRLNIISPYLFN